MNPEDAELWFNLGIKYLARNDVVEEIKMYERATNIDPNMGGAWNNWGIALGEQRKFDEVMHKLDFMVFRIRFFFQIILFFFVFMLKIV